MNIKIEDSFKKLDKYPTVVERYYSKYHFKPDGLAEDETHCILVHSNRICLITLAESHPIIMNKKKISTISFQITDKLDRKDNKVTGKGKKGAQFMAPNSILCYITCDDGTKYSVYGCVKGKLIEINQNLLENFQLLVDKPLGEGYIGIILPNLRDVEDMKKGFEFCSGPSDDFLDQDD